jgi:serine/threonine protein kinase
MADFHEIAGYEVLSTLGFGARSTIYAVRDPKIGEVYALKRVVKSSPSDQRYLDQAIQEHEIASKFDHASLRKSLRLIKQREFIRVSEVLVLMEMVDGKTLEHYQAKDMVDLVEIIQQVADGLVVMHQKQFVHADIKPNNVMVTERGEVKIIDFGQSCPTGTQKQRIQGTPDYIAPEQVLRKPITPQTDVFNLGATLYWLLTRKHVPTLIPKRGAGIQLRVERRCDTPAEVNPEVPPALSSLVMDCIETSPSERPATMTEVSSRLEIARAQLARKDVDTEVAEPRRNAG